MVATKKRLVWRTQQGRTKIYGCTLYSTFAQYAASTAPNNGDRHGDGDGHTVEGIVTAMVTATVMGRPCCRPR